MPSRRRRRSPSSMIAAGSRAPTCILARRRSVPLQAGRARQVQGHPVGRLPEGRHRPEGGQRRRHRGMDGLDEGQHAGRRAERQPERGRLHVRQDARAGAEAVRRRPDAARTSWSGRRTSRTSTGRCCCCPATQSTPAPTDYRVIQAMKRQRFNGRAGILPRTDRLLPDRGPHSVVPSGAKDLVSAPKNASGRGARSFASLRMMAAGETPAVRRA